jgi:serine/threonine-protein kinase HipA
MVRLAIWLDRDLVGWLAHDPASNRFAFDYAPAWQDDSRSFPVSPRLPFVRESGQTAESHSTEVRQFFENLLPEGEALDHAAQANGISKSNLVGLMVALGKETAGALRVALADGAPAAPSNVPQPELRLVTPAELSARIRDRAHIPFSVWDGKVRLSIAGYQDKIAVYERASEWFLVEGTRLASTVIIKPVPSRPQLQSLPENEFMCMQLAQRVGLDVPHTRLVFVPEPVLLVSRFDRVETDVRVERLHLIDGCQALGLSVGMKYERPYGDGEHVRNIRDGVTYAKLFRLLDQSAVPAVDRRALLRWVIFQVLIGNTDAHGKNLSFYYSSAGLRLCPAYDLVCMEALGYDALQDRYAMAIGDAFTAADLNAFEWASFAVECGLPIPLVSQQLRQVATRVMDLLPDVVDDVSKSGVSDEVARRIAGIVEKNSLHWIEHAPAVNKVRERDVK